jgi:hypothetical protein
LNACDDVAVDMDVDVIGYRPDVIMGPGSGHVLPLTSAGYRAVSSPPHAQAIARGQFPPAGGTCHHRFALPAIRSWPHAACFAGFAAAGGGCSVWA